MLLPNCAFERSVKRNRMRTASTLAQCAPTAQSRLSRGRSTRAINWEPARALLAVALCNLLLCSCALEPTKRPRLTLEGAIQALPTLNSASALIAAMGEPDYRIRYDHDNPADNIVFRNRMPLASWKAHEVTSPPGLLDFLPVGTILFQYEFVLQEDAINPWSDLLEVCLNDDGRIVGWMYGDSFVGREKTSKLR